MKGMCETVDVFCEPMTESNLLRIQLTALTVHKDHWRYTSAHCSGVSVLGSSRGGMKTVSSRAFASISADFPAPHGSMCAHHAPVPTPASTSRRRCRSTLGLAMLRGTMQT